MTPWVPLLGPALAVAAIGALVLGGDALWPGRGRLWGWVSVLNGQHARWAWLSLFSVALTDLYIYLLATGTFDDPRFF